MIKTNDGREVKNFIYYPGGVQFGDVVSGLNAIKTFHCTWTNGVFAGDPTHRLSISREFRRG